ncbi:hypothetical protein C2E23DRAFT_189128 [Lenzites betulinus]|nr:hypothetical protein C2E23DRAFT_189128 [Lenzites betulinus]
MSHPSVSGRAKASLLTMSIPEDQIDPTVIPPLDATLLSLSDRELAFLRFAITEDEVKLKKIVSDVQGRAYAKYPYPCIRAFHFVKLMMEANDVYPAVIEAGKNDPTSLFLDIGCCMGTDVRKLVHDGYPATQVLACDLVPEYIALGHELFADADRSAIRFLTSNALDLSPEPAPEDGAQLQSILDPSAAISDLAQLRGALAHVYTGALFHLFDKETQLGLARRIAVLLRRRPGAVVFGRHQGLQEEGYVDDYGYLGRKRYSHSETSWPRLWKKVFAELEGEEFADRVVVKAKLVEKFWQITPDELNHAYMLYWSVEIV